MNINETFGPFTSGANISGTLRLECQKKNFSVRHDVFYERLNEGDMVWAPDSRLTIHKCEARLTKLLAHRFTRLQMLYKINTIFQRDPM